MQFYMLSRNNLFLFLVEITGFSFLENSVSKNFGLNISTHLLILTTFDCQ